MGSEIIHAKAALMTSPELIKQPINDQHSDGRNNVAGGVTRLRLNTFARCKEIISSAEGSDR